MTEPSTASARAVVTALLRAGVRDVVVAPGSRNAPLSFALWDAAQANLLRLHTRVDERSAGFVALGLTKVGARAAVVCTSGTAVANLHPALLEAAHSGVPVIAVTADRPARLRGTGANQTTDQVGIFGALVATHDLAPRQDVPALDGVVHLNVQLDDPLVPTSLWTDLPAPTEPPREPHPWRGRHLEVIDVDRRTVVVAGDDAGPPARVLAERAGWPLLAEPSAGCRTGHTPLRTYRLLLCSELAAEVERVVVMGHPTLSRPVMRLLARHDVEVLAAPTPGVWAHRPFPVHREIAWGEPSLDQPAADPAWLERWQAADRAVSAQLDALLAAEPDVTPHEVAGAVAAAVPPGGLLLVGASNPVRDLDVMIRGWAVGDRRKVLANRGLAGIDGVVSTAIGAALGRRSTRSLALVGDVTFLHDANGLVLGPDEPEPDLTIVVVNDDGGSIFATLEQGDPVHADRFERVFGTPHRVDLGSLCAATRTPHWAVESLPELEQALANPNGGIEVVEVRVRRDNRRELDARIRALRP